MGDSWFYGEENSINGELLELEDCLKFWYDKI